MFTLIVVALAALFIAIFVLVVALAADSGTSGVDRTLATIDGTYGPSGTVLSPQDGPFAERIAAPLMRRVGGLGRALTPAGAITRLEARLDQAGNPVGWPAERIVQAKGAGLIALGLVGAVIGALYLGVLGVVLGGVIGALVGFVAPSAIVYDLAQRRQQEIRQTLPDILDMLTISVEAGLGFDAALAQVAENGKGPMKGETGRVLQEMQIGKPRAEAIRAMGERTIVNELRIFSSAVVQASELGIPIANVLREQAKEMRILRRQRAEERAQKVPIKILFPLIFCLFPAMFIVIIGPGALKIIALFAAA